MQALLTDRNMKKKFRGVVVPMITPVNTDYTIDTASAERLVNYITGNGAAPFILGTTGESASVSRKQKTILVETVVKAAGGKNLVYAGISGNAIMDSIEDAHQYHDMGADVFVATMASYYPADADQMLRYFIMLADRIPAPLILYNIPGTTHLSIPLEVVEQLSAHPNIVGFKDSERNLERLEASISRWKDRADFSFLTGWAAQSSRAMKLGADGIIPGTANLTPGIYEAICRYAAGQDDVKAKAAQDKADKISEMYQKDRSLSYSLPVLKAMMAAYGLCRPCMLPPMFQLSSGEQQSVREMILSQFGDLNQINSLNHNE